MKLYYSNYSVFSRKVRMVISTLGLYERIEFISIHAENNLFIAKVNPLKQVPVLIIDENTNLFGAIPICQYLNELAEGQSIFPKEESEYFQSLRLEALADGVIPFIDQIVEERFRPKEQQLADLQAENFELIDQSMQWLEAHISDFNSNITIGEISVACFLDYLGFQFRSEVADWPDKYPQLGKWFDDFKHQEIMQSTKYHSI